MRALGLKSNYVKQGRENGEGPGLWGRELVGMGQVAEPASCLGAGEISLPHKLRGTGGRMLQWGGGSHSSPPRTYVTLWLLGVVLGDFSRSSSDGRGPAGSSFPGARLAASPELGTA